MVDVSVKGEFLLFFAAILTESLGEFFVLSPLERVASAVRDEVRVEVFARNAQFVAEGAFA